MTQDILYFIRCIFFQINYCVNHLIWFQVLLAKTNSSFWCLLQDKDAQLFVYFLKFFYSKYSKSSFRVTATLNIVSFVLFRILPMCWMTRWATIHCNDIPLATFVIGSLGLATMIGLNTLLFYRILMSEYQSLILMKKEGYQDISEESRLGDMEILRLRSQNKGRDNKHILFSIFNKQD